MNKGHLKGKLEQFKTKNEKRNYILNNIPIISMADMLIELIESGDDIDNNTIYVSSETYMTMVNIQTKLWDRIKIKQNDGRGRPVKFIDDPLPVAIEKLLQSNQLSISKGIIKPEQIVHKHCVARYKNVEFDKIPQDDKNYLSENYPATFNLLKSSTEQVGLINILNSEKLDQE